MSLCTFGLHFNNIFQSLFWYIFLKHIITITLFSVLSVQKVTIYFITYLFNYFKLQGLKLRAPNKKVKIMLPVGEKKKLTKA